MKKNHKFPHFFADVNENEKTFDCSRHDIEAVCRFFSLGKLKSFEKEKGTTFAHFNSFVFAATTQGRYALKFYSPKAVRSIATEYALNRILLNGRFPTPIMYTGPNRQIFLPILGRLTTCYSYIDGLEAWQAIKQRDIFSKINEALFSIKNILSATHECPPLPKSKSLGTTINALMENSRRTSVYDQKKLIHTFLLNACRTYQCHQRLFTRQRLHSNTHLDNFLIYKNNIYTLDLSHIQEDYVLVDLRGVVDTCLFLNTPVPTIKAIIKDYLTRHKMGAQYVLVLDTLIKIRLIKEYLNYIQYKNSVKLYERQKAVITALNKMNDIARSMTCC